MWDRFWSTARFHLGLSDREFFSLTPRQYHLLMERHRERATHQEFLAGLVAATVHNLSGRIASKILSPSDFMPSLNRSKEKKREKRMNRKQIAEDIRGFLNARMAEQSRAK